MIKMWLTLPKGNDTCCHICTKCQNPCPQQNQCSGACAGCPHPCWVNWNEYKVTWDFRANKPKDVK